MSAGAMGRAYRAPKGAFSAHDECIAMHLVHRLIGTCVFGPPAHQHRGAVCTRQMQACREGWGRSGPMRLGAGTPQCPDRHRAHDGGGTATHPLHRHPWSCLFPSLTHKHGSTLGGKSDMDRSMSKTLRPLLQYHLRPISD